MVTILKDVPVPGLEVIPCRLKGPRGVVKSFLLHDEQSAVLVDTGQSADDAEAIVTRLRAIGRGVDDLDAIVLTHRHRDHVGGLYSLLDRATVPVLAHGAEADGIEEVGGMRPSRLLDDDEPLGILDIHSIHMPGHTPGSIALYWPRHGAVFTGDAIVSAGEHLMVSPAFLCMDPDLARESVRRLLDLGLALDMVLVAHGEDVYANTAQPLGRILDTVRKV